MPGKRQLVNVEPLTTLRSHSQRRTGFLAEQYRAAAIGRTGAGNYGHGLHIAYASIDNVDFIAVADADEAGRGQAREQTGATRAYADFRDMLAAETPDLVSVCPRWTDCHLEMVIACLESGAHVYCEKPMTWNLADGDVIVSRADALGRKVAVAHQAVYLPRIQQLRVLLREGRIGQVQQIHAHGKQDRRGGGEDMITLGTHLFNMMRYFAGDVSWMSGHVTVDGRELELGDVGEATEPVGPVAGDCVEAYYAFDSGVAGFFDSRRDQAGSSQRYGMEIVGSEGTISSYDYEETIKVQTRAHPEGEERPVDVLEKPFQNPVQYVIHCIEAGQPIEGPLSPEMCRVGQQIVDTACQSAVEKRTLPLVQ